jgi:S-formylglutathione hydrolase FrmB
MKFLFHRIPCCLVGLLFTFVIAGCSQSQGLNRAQKPTSEITTEPTPDNTSPTTPENTTVSSMTQLTGAIAGWNKNLMVDDVPYDLYIPPNYNNRPDSNLALPCILVLPGWDTTRNISVEKTPLVEYANQYGYALILPEMLVTIYESRYYPETEMKWNQLPGGQFIKERFIPTIQQRHNLLKTGQHNTLLGFSTGGRGVALIALENPDLFVAGASLAGDFSQENMPNDNLMTSVYGPFDRFPERWTGRDNPQARVAEWKMPLYLAHGQADSVVPPAQSRLFYEALVNHHGTNIIVEYREIAGAGHGAKFISQELPNVFQFFQ